MCRSRALQPCISRSNMALNNFCLRVHRHVRHGRFVWESSAYMRMPVCRSASCARLLRRRLHLRATALVRRAVLQAGQMPLLTPTPRAKSATTRMRAGPSQQRGSEAVTPGNTPFTFHPTRRTHVGTSRRTLSAAQHWIHVRMSWWLRPTSRQTTCSCFCTSDRKWGLPARSSCFMRTTLVPSVKWAALGEADCSVLVYPRLVERPSCPAF